SASYCCTCISCAATASGSSPRPSDNCSGRTGNSFHGSTLQLTNLTARLRSSLGGQTNTISSATMTSTHHCELFGRHIVAPPDPADHLEPRSSRRHEEIRSKLSFVSSWPSWCTMPAAGEKPSRPL